jgi:hypothetical protein
MHEFSSVQTTFKVRRWDAGQTLWVKERKGLLFDPTARDFDDLGVTPYLETVHENANLITELGWAALLGGVAGTSIGTKFSSAAGRIGVGTSSTAATAADTTLGGDTGGGSTTSYFQLVSGAPVINTSSAVSTLTFASTFGTGVANFAWNELGIDNGTASGVTVSGIFINHGISSQGTKVSGQTWNATAILNFGYSASLS